MWTTTIKGAQVTLNNRDRNRLLERFHSLNISETNEACTIFKPCICSYYNGERYRCPLAIYSDKSNKDCGEECLDLIQSLIGSTRLVFNDDYIEFRKFYECEAKKDLLTIYRTILNMKDITHKRYQKEG